ncbi:MAG: VCBS repeat-containing protein [Bacteroidia bacterium]|nr:VCBS repeat-containing protein [Bacteroidia bacterium]
MVYRNCLLLFLSLLFFACENTSEKSFSLLSENKTGISFQNTLQESEQFNVLNYGYFYNGGGVAIGDLNNDGLSDIYFTGNLVASHLYLNKGNLEFEEIAEEAGVTAEGLWNTGVSMADVNADGWLDIYVSRSAAADPQARKNLLFINNHDLTFTEQAELYGIADPGYSTQGLFFDYDRDGDLDLFVLNHSVQEYAGFSQLLHQLKTRENSFYGDKLYRNDQIPPPGQPQGKFKDVTGSAGILTNVLGFGLGVGAADFNRDGWPDIYVSNDYNEPDYLYINQQNGSFKESLSEYIDHVSLFSMGSDIADINNDGLPDILSLDMLPEDHFRQKMSIGADNFEKNQRLVSAGFHKQYMRNMLQLNNGNGTFSEMGQLAGISNTDWSWAALFADYDNDGFQDLFITNGYKRDYTNMDFMAFAADEKIKSDQKNKAIALKDLLSQMPPIEVPNYIYKNNGDLTFSKKTDEWGFEKVFLSNGAAYGDLDNDGDLDLVVNNVNAPASLYRNNLPKSDSSHFLRLKFIGNNANPFSIGTEVCVVFKEKETRLCQTMMPVRGFQSSVEPLLFFGLGKNTAIEYLEIHWPTGESQYITSPPVDTLLEIAQLGGEIAQNTPERSFLFSPQNPLFEYVHLENAFVDFKTQPLIPHFLSTQGPKIARGDVNGDGKEDLFLGGAKGYPGKIFIRQADLTWKNLPQPALETDAASEDMEALFLDVDNDGDKDLYVTSGGYEFAPEDPALQDRLYLNDGRGFFTRAANALPLMFTSASCVTAADIDNDGDSDLFVGGRLIPGKYPLAARSYILQNDGKGLYTDITSSFCPALLQPGMITDALWTDVNADKSPDLVIVGEWMPVRIFVNTPSGLNEISGAGGLNKSEGWWNVVSAADMDHDGDTDFVVGNYGLNTQIKASVTEPASLYTKDFDNNGTIDPILCYYQEGKNYPMPWRDDLIGQLPKLKGKYIKYSDYAEATITDIFSSEDLKDAEVLEAFTFSTSWIENQGNGQFRIISLPIEAQISPVYALILEDINSDSHPDIILAGNLNGTRVKLGVYDGNHGVVLQGDGKGNFTPMKPTATGLKITGEVRDMAWVEGGQGKTLIIVRNNQQPEFYRLNSNLP